MRAAVVALLAAALATVSATAGAKATEVSPYSYKQIFGAAVRLLKVDMELEIVELDAEWGYLLFHYVSADSGKRKNRGALQFVQLDEAVQVSVQLPQMPSHHEQAIVDRLKRKLTEDYGAPPKRRPPSPPPGGDGKPGEGGAERKDDAKERKDGSAGRKDDPGRSDEGREPPSGSEPPRIIEPNRAPLRRP